MYSICFLKQLYFFSEEDFWYCGFTIGFMLLPFTVNFFSKCIEICKGEAKKAELVTCLYFLPGFQVYYLCRLVKNQFIAIDKLKEQQEFQKRMTALLRESKSLEKNDEWNPRKLEQQTSFHAERKDLENLSQLIKKKHGQDGYFNGSASLEILKLVDDEIKRKQKDLGKANAEIRYFRTMEAFLESAPQFILQSCAVIRSDPTFKNIPVWSILTIVTSYASLMTMIKVFLQMPHLIISTPEHKTTNIDNVEPEIEEEEEGKEYVLYGSHNYVAPFRCWKNYLIVVPVMTLIVTPRMLILSIYFATIRYGFCIAILAGILTVYSILFWLLIPDKFFKEKKIEKFLGKFLSLHWLTSIYGPCVVIEPNSSPIFLSCMISSLGYFLLLGSMTLKSYINVGLHSWNLEGLTESEIQQLVNYYKIFCWSMMGFIPLTSLLSHFLLEENRQLLGLKMGLKSICCSSNEQFHWACKKEYGRLIKHYLASGKEHVIKATNVDGLTGFQYAYMNKKHLAMEIMIQYPSYLDATSEEVGCIFEQACFRGDTKVVQLLLSHENSRSLIIAKDGEQKTGFTRACQMGRVDIVSLLIDHPNSLEMFGIKDGKGWTGFMTACRWGKTTVIKRLLQQEYYKEMQKEYFKQVEDPEVTKNEVHLGYDLAKEHKVPRAF